MTQKFSDLEPELQRQIACTATGFYMACHALQQHTGYDATEWQQIIDVAATDAVAKMTPRQFKNLIANFDTQAPAEFSELGYPTPSDWDDMGEKLKALAGQHIPVYLDPFFCFVLIAQLQLALRHPANTGPAADLTSRFAHHLIDRLAEVLPETREIALKGFDPAFDL